MVGETNKILLMKTLKHLLYYPWRVKHFKGCTLVKIFIMFPLKTDETLVDEGIETSISPPSEESINEEISQIYDDKLTNIFISLSFEDKVNQVYDVMDTSFRVFYYNRDNDHWKFYGDQIYDASSDESIDKNVEFEPLG